MGSPQTIKPESGLISVPLNYPTVPTPGKLELLIQANDTSIYHRYSPYVDYHTPFYGLLNFGAKQPFIYDYIDEAKGGFSWARKYESRIFPLGSAPRDVTRISKYLLSGDGVLFLGKQFLLQASSVYNETRIYNPTSPIVAAGMGLALGLVRPKRHFDLSGGLLGIARTLIGDTIPNILGADQTVGAPPGSVGVGALPDANKKTDAKGLLRANTAGVGYSHFTSKWQPPNTGKFSWKSLGKSLINSLIPNTFRLSQPEGTVFRGDEGSYGIMIAGSDRFKYDGNSRSGLEFGQKWIAGLHTKDGIRKNNQLTPKPYWLITNPNGTVMIKYSHAGILEFIDGVGSVGYDISLSQTNKDKPGIRYGNSVGVSKDENYEASDIMLQYAEYVKEENKYPTKRIDHKSIQKVNESLDKLIRSLKKSGVYDITPEEESKMLPAPISNPAKNGYNALFATTDKTRERTGLNYPKGVLSKYLDKDIRMIDNSVSNDIAKKSLKLPGAGNFDAINTLRILPGKKSSNERYIKSSDIPGWTKWEPYKDDQIAFFFYDIVNDKYIPFRATVKGINESSYANWEDLSFIGRADHLYSYGGFTRALQFSFDIVISSIIELAPTWKRINYLMTLTKPANYTVSSNQLPFNRFMVPPMVELTIGDLYKKQPILIQSVTVNIPDDASWETMNEENSIDKEWFYLVNYIKSDKIKSNRKEFGQFPLEAKISLSTIILEKERAIAGGANFGHAPHTDEYHPLDIENQPYMHQALVEYQYGRNVVLTSNEDKRTFGNEKIFPSVSQGESNPPPSFDSKDYKPTKVTTGVETPSFTPIPGIETNPLITLPRI
jgi:hypothetical protein